MHKLKINIDKTDILNDYNISLNITINDSLLDNVDNYTFLSIYIGP